ncbi:MAG: YbaN family protein [Coriobacteriia bacterium]
MCPRPLGSPFAVLKTVKPLLRHVLLALGWVFLGLGVIGAALPVLPTTPFLLLAAACFMRSSERLHRWLVDHPRYGHHIRDYLEGKGLRARTKVVAISMLWASILTSVFLFVPYLAADLLLVAIAAAVTAYLLRLPTPPE